METNKTSLKEKTERLKMIRARSAARRGAIAKSVQAEAELAQQELKTTQIDEKSLQNINTLTGYLSVGVALSVLMLIVQIWATFKAGFVLTSVSVIYIFFSAVLIGSLVWCIQLLKQRRTSALWVFIGFIAANFFYTLAFRYSGGKDLFTLSNVIAYIVQAAILFEIYRLKSRGILH